MTTRSIYAGVAPAMALASSVLLQALICSAVFASAARGDSERPASPSAPIVAGKEGERIDAFLTSLAGFGYRGAMLVVRKERIVLRQGYGFADDESNVQNAPGTLFDVGSFAKTFTAAAILQLEEARKLRVTDSIGEYFPTLPADKAGVTIHQILSHTSGLTDDFGNYEDVGKDEALSRIFALPLRFTPGTDFAYSNGGYVVLAAIVERVSGESYRDYLRGHIFGPAGMRETGFWGKEAPAVDPTRIAHAHDELGEVGNPLAWSDSTWYDLGGGMVLSTVDDLCAWITALDRGSVLTQPSVERLFTPVGKETSSGRYGYGWYIDTASPYGTLIHHGGDSVGFGAQVSWYREAGVIVVSLCNVRHDWFPTHVRADRVVPKILFGDSFTSPPVCRSRQGGELEDGILPDREVAAEMAGRYRLPTGGEWILENRPRGVVMGALGQDAIDILTGATAEESAVRERQSETMERAFGGLPRGEFAAFDSATGEPGGGFRAAVLQEMRDLGGGPVTSVELLGTFPGTFPPGSLVTLFRLHYADGKSIPYRVPVMNGRIQATSDRTEPFCAAVPLQPVALGAQAAPQQPSRAASFTLFAGWDIIAEKGFKIAPVRRDGRIDGIRFYRDRTRWEARRVE